MQPMLSKRERNPLKIVVVIQNSSWEGDCSNFDMSHSESLGIICSWNCSSNKKSLKVSPKIVPNLRVAPEIGTDHSKIKHSIMEYSAYTCLIYFASFKVYLVIDILIYV